MIFIFSRPTKMWLNGKMVNFLALGARPEDVGSNPALATHSFIRMRPFIYSTLHERLLLSKALSWANEQFLWCGKCVTHR